MIILKKNNFPKIEGKILDVGCGGSSIISYMYNDVIGIDKNITELYEDRNNFYKLPFDYAEDNFKENYFNAITFYFSLMYMEQFEEKAKAIKNSYLDLKPSGKIYIWDTIIKETSPELFTIEISVPSAKSIINPTLYGVSKNNHL